MKKICFVLCQLRFSLVYSKNRICREKKLIWSPKDQNSINFLFVYHSMNLFKSILEKKIKNQMQMIWYLLAGWDMTVALRYMYKCQTSQSTDNCIENTVKHIKQIQAYKRHLSPCNDFVRKLYIHVILFPFETLINCTCLAKTENRNM